MTYGASTLTGIIADGRSGSNRNKDAEIEHYMANYSRWEIGE